MSKANYCQERMEIALIRSEDDTVSEQHRREAAEAARWWGDLADYYLQRDLDVYLLPGGVAVKRA